MSNYIEYNDTIAFHPGYYIKEIVEESGLTQEDFAKRLDTTPKNLSLLIRGEQSLSIDIAMKLSRMLGTSVNYWLNLQNLNHKKNCWKKEKYLNYMTTNILERIMGFRICLEKRMNRLKRFVNF